MAGWPALPVDEGGWRPVSPASERSSWLLAPATAPRSRSRCCHNTSKSSTSGIIGIITLTDTSSCFKDSYIVVSGPAYQVRALHGCTLVWWVRMRWISNVADTSSADRAPCSAQREVGAVSQARLQLHARRMMTRVQAPTGRSCLLAKSRTGTAIRSPCSMMLAERGGRGPGTHRHVGTATRSVVGRSTNHPWEHHVPCPATLKSAYMSIRAVSR